MIPVRPRPGKPVVARDSYVSVLLGKMLFSDIPWGTEPRVTIKYIRTGPVQLAMTSTGNEISMDSGFRLTASGGLEKVKRSIPLPLGTASAVAVGDLIQGNHQNGVFIHPCTFDTVAPVHVGAKLLLFGPEGQTYLFKDKGKDLDLIGGRVESGETSYEALVREVKEESGYVGVAPRRFGISVANTPQGQFYSVMYAAPLPDNFPREQLVAIRGYATEKLVLTPWTWRLLWAAFEWCPDPLLLPERYASLPEPREISIIVLQGYLKVAPRMVKGYQYQPFMGVARTLHGFFFADLSTGHPPKRYIPLSRRGPGKGGGIGELERAD